MLSALVYMHSVSCPHRTSCQGISPVQDDQAVTEPIGRVGSASDERVDPESPIHAPTDTNSNPSSERAALVPRKNGLGSLSDRID